MHVRFSAASARLRRFTHTNERAFGAVGPCPTPAYENLQQDKVKARQRRRDGKVAKEGEKETVLLSERELQNALETSLAYLYPLSCARRFLRRLVSLLPLMLGGRGSNGLSMGASGIEGLPFLADLRTRQPLMSQGP